MSFLGAIGEVLTVKGKHASKQKRIIEQKKAKKRAIGCSVLWCLSFTIGSVLLKGKDGQLLYEILVVLSMAVYFIPLLHYIRRNADQAKMAKYSKIIRYFTYFVTMIFIVCTVIVLAEIVAFLFM